MMTLRVQVDFQYGTIRFYDLAKAMSEAFGSHPPATATVMFDMTTAMILDASINGHRSIWGLGFGHDVTIPFRGGHVQIAVRDEVPRGEIRLLVDDELVGILANFDTTLYNYPVPDWESTSDEDGFTAIVTSPHEPSQSPDSHGQ